MKTIENILDGVNKFGDTETVFRLMLKDGDDYVSLDNKRVVLNIANSYGLVLSIPLTNQVGYTIELDFKSEELSKLTPDAYKLEFEVTTIDGDVAKFPTKDGLPFHITNNLKQTQGALIPTITFDEVLSAVDDKVNEYLHTIQKGDKGDKGDTGATGQTGKEGQKGDKGDTGPQGIRGEQGKEGIQGPIGPTGPQGIQGPIGPTGPQGDKGLKGDIGPQGTQGIQGDKGDKGDTGVVDTAADYTWTGTNTFNNKIIATAGVQGNADTATKLQTPRKINGTNFDGTSDINVNAANDSNLVHLTGTETIAGDKTFTGNNIFTNPINGYIKTKDVPSTDVNLIKTPGQYQLEANYTNIPVGMAGSAILTVAMNAPGTIFYQYIFSRNVANSNGDIDFFMRLYINNTWTTWRRMAQDWNVVHNTGVETVAGNKTFTGNNIFSGSILLQTGNYGLRVTPSGIQKTSDGGTTWVNI